LKAEANFEAKINYKINYITIGKRLSTIQAIIVLDGRKTSQRSSFFFSLLILLLLLLSSSFQT
jgi:hypothetical protein